MSEQPYSRPSMDQYFMGIAMAVRKRANCTGNRVGAIIVKDKHVLSTGYNGTPHGITNCMEGGCHRCANRDEYPSSTGYDLCICVHAEQNALLQAARFGIAVEGGTMYSTMRPCFGCTKELLQAGIREVVYLHEWLPPASAQRKEYERLQRHFPDGVRRLPMPDPDEVWAVAKKRDSSIAREAEEVGAATDELGFGPP